MMFSAFLLSLCGCVLFYLSLNNQQWLTRPLPNRPWRWLAWLVLGLSFAAWMWVIDAKAGFFAALVCAMLLLGLLPFFSLLNKKGAKHGQA
ncbi:hypothetical protein KJY73_17915 [Bowmanella sp. Y26]|uniref:hypothetical protein n=1 Tax=Bowmanella yangjiangensis TaxID=2811230 RepID=UPI001BDC2D10|nr:hypothetical protein [Bowmanella yangjiangensis]MBT1065468.1 hypothetical protein [Bowmanella yangjiangensis]